MRPTNQSNRLDAAASSLQTRRYLDKLSTKVQTKLNLSKNREADAILQAAAIINTHVLPMAVQAHLQLLGGDLHHVTREVLADYIYSRSRSNYRNHSDGK